MGHDLAELEITSAHFIGCSFGAGVCAELALEQPALVASLLLHGGLDMDTVREAADSVNG